MELLDLPEEIINRVAHFFTQQATIAIAALVSRKLNRIVTPHLYGKVSLMVSKCERTVPFIIAEIDNILSNFPSIAFERKLDLPTIRGCNALAFIRTIRRRPELGLYVKCLHLHRQDYGFVYRRALGYYDDGVKLRLPSRGVPLRLSLFRLLEPRPDRLTSSMDPAYEVVLTLLRILPRLTRLSCSAYDTDVPWNPILGLMGSLATLKMAQHDFSQLRVLTINGYHKPLSKLWPIFTLPSLHTLGITGVQLNTTLCPDAELGMWDLMVKRNSIKVLILLNIYVNVGGPSEVDLAPLRLLFATLEQLRCLTLAAKETAITEKLLSTCLCHLPALISLDVYENRPTSMTTGIALAQQEVLQPDVPSSLNLLRQSKILRQLSIDVGMLLTLTPFSLASEHPSILGSSPIITTEELARQEFAANVDLSLPHSLRSLKLRVCDESMLQTELLRALETSLMDLRLRFPKLRKLEIAWKMGGLVTAAKGANNLSSAVVAKLRCEGIEVVESLLP